MIKSSIGPLITLASIKRRLLTSSIDDWRSIKKPGIEAPAVTEISEATTPMRETRLTLLVLNQVIAILLGVLRIKMLPIAANEEPNRQYAG